MDRSDDRSPDAPPEKAPVGPRKPYQRPEVIAEEVFETLALACGKTVSNPMGLIDCQLSPAS